MNSFHSSLSLSCAVNSSRLQASASRLGATEALTTARQLGSMLNCGTWLGASTMCDAVSMMGKSEALFYSRPVVSHYSNAQAELRVAVVGFAHLR